MNAQIWSCSDFPFCSILLLLNSLSIIKQASCTNLPFSSITTTKKGINPS
jgi:hypothetical protein